MGKYHVLVSGYTAKKKLRSFMLNLRFIEEHFLIFYGEFEISSTTLMGDL